MSYELNARAAGLADIMEAEAALLRIGVSRGGRGERVIDAGSRHQGGVAAGLRLAGICMAGLAEVTAFHSSLLPRWPWALSVACSNPVISCLGSQYAGWSLKHGGFFALGSGPARALARKEDVFHDIAYGETADTAVLVLESAEPPPPEVIDEIATACRVTPHKITILYAPTQSLAGSVQVTARVLEVALHKAHALKYPLARIVDGMATAPLAPPHPDFVTAMGRTNDAIIFGGHVHLFVTGSAADAKALAGQLPSNTSRDYGKPFAEVFAAFKGDFYAIDPMLFSPAHVIVTAIETGESFRAGGVNAQLVDASFG